jgi:peroxiredoxin
MVLACNMLAYLLEEVMMREIASQMIDLGEMLPQFQLPAAGGRMIRLWDYKQRRQVVLLALHGLDCADCQKLLASFAGRYADFREQETEILALLPMAPEALEHWQAQLDLPFPLLADATGKTLARLGAWDGALQAVLPTVLVADRYGALYSRYTAASEGDLPAPDVVLKDLEYIAIQCPE